jgi:hypothetical protein
VIATFVRDIYQPQRFGTEGGRERNGGVRVWGGSERGKDKLQNGRACTLEEADLEAGLAVDQAGAEGAAEEMETLQGDEQVIDGGPKCWNIV